MKSRTRVICTLTVGEFYQELASISHPMISAYAEKCNADFVVFDRLTTQVPGYTKFDLIRGLLKKYERVLYLDTDLLVRFDAPDLFEMYESDTFVAFNEEHLFPERAAQKANFCAANSLPVPPGWTDSKRYYNTGVMLCSRDHAGVFQQGVAEKLKEVDHFGEQTYLNYRLYTAGGLRVADLPYRFNRLIKTLRKSGEPVDDSFIMHFAGSFVEPHKNANLKTWHELAGRFAAYKAAGEAPEFPRKIYMGLTGGLGDVVSHEPLVRYVRKVLEPKADITIRTQFPEVFRHLEGFPRTKVIRSGEFIEDKGHLQLHTIPPKAIANYNQMHPLDYASLAIFQGHIPKEHRRIELWHTEKDAGFMRHHVLVHPGKSWPSKTFPVDYWNKIITGLKSKVPVAIIGKTYPSDDVTGRGTVDVDASGCFDLRNTMSLGELFGAIAQARCLVTNDSSPVHIAGAFETPVVLITTVKPAEFIFPQRDPALNIALGRPIKASEPVLGVVNNVTLDECTDAELRAALPHPDDVITAALKAYGYEIDRRPNTRTRENSGSSGASRRRATPVES